MPYAWAVLYKVSLLLRVNFEGHAVYYHAENVMFYVHYTKQCYFFKITLFEFYVYAIYINTNLMKLKSKIVK